jgi:hypothetical protein
MIRRSNQRTLCLSSGSGDFREIGVGSGAVRRSLQQPFVIEMNSSQNAVFISGGEAPNHASTQYQDHEHSSIFTEQSKEIFSISRFGHTQ